MSDGRVVIDSYFDKDQAQQGWDDLQSSIQSGADKVGDAGKKLSKTVTAPLVGVGSAALWTGASFEQQMSKVEAVSGATGAELEMLEDTAREMGSTTQFSASDAAQGLEYMSLAGWEAEEMATALPGVLDLAAAGAVELGEASDIVTDMMSVFGMEADEAGTASDIFAYAQANANTSVSELGEALSKAGPTASAAGADMEETSAILGVFADNGVKGSKAGTILESMYNDVRDSAEDGAIAIGDASVEVYDAEGNMRSMAEIMADVEGATEGMTGKKKDEAMASIFQQQSQRGANLIMEEGTDAVFDLEDGLRNSEGAANDMAETTQDNLMGALDGLKSTMEGLLLDVFDIIGPYIQQAIEFLDDLATRFSELDDSTKETIVAIGAVAAAIGPLLMAVPLITKLIGIMGTGFLTLISPITTVIGTIASMAAGLTSAGGIMAAMTGPVGIAVAAVLGLIAIGIQLYQNWDIVKERFAIATQAFQPLLSTLQGAFQDFMSHLQPIWQSLIELFNSVRPILEAIGVVVVGVVVTAFGVLISTVAAVMSAIGPFIDAIVNLGTMFMNVFNSIIAILTGDFSLAWEYWTAAGDNAVAFFMGLFEGVVNFVSTFVSTIVDFFVGLYQTLVGNSIIPDMVNAILDWFQNLFSWVGDVVSNIVSAVTSAFSSVYGAIENYLSLAQSIVSSILTYIQETFSNILSFVVALVQGDFQGMRDAIQSQMQSAQDLVSNILSAIGDFFGNILSSIVSTVTDRFSSIYNTISDRISSAQATISNITSSIKSTFSNIFNSLSGIVTSAFSSVTSSVSSGIQSAYDIVTGFVSNFFSAGRNIVTSIADGITSAVGNVTSAIGDVAGKVRDFLPFSPAEEGPFRDIHKLNFGGPISDSMKDDEGEISKSAEKMTAAAMPDVSGAKMMMFDDGKKGSSNVSNNQEVNINIDYDGDGSEEDAENLADMINEKLGQKASLDKFFKGVKA